MTKMKSFLLSICVFLSINLVTISCTNYTSEKEDRSINSKTFTREVVDLGKTYDFFTNENVALRFYIVIIAQVNDNMK